MYSANEPSHVPYTGSPTSKARHFFTARLDVAGKTPPGISRLGHTQPESHGPHEIRPPGHDVPCSAVDARRLDTDEHLVVTDGRLLLFREPKDNVGIGAVRALTNGLHPVISHRGATWLQRRGAVASARFRRPVSKSGRPHRDRGDGAVSDTTAMATPGVSPRCTTSSAPIGTGCPKHLSAGAARPLR